MVRGLKYNWPTLWSNVVYESAKLNCRKIRMSKATVFSLGLTVFILFLTVLLVNAHDHGHSHGGHDHSHGRHDHGGHNHGHSHDDHGHSHGKHNHLDPDDYEHEDHRHLYYRPEGNVEEEHESHKERVLDEHQQSHDESNVKKHQHSESKPPLNRFEPWTWMNAIGATLLISAAPYLLLFLIPLEKNTEEQKPLLKVLLSFASGGLLGDAFLHLIPHAVSPHSHGDDHSHSHGDDHSHEAHDHDGSMIVGLWVLAGIVAFLMVEKFVRYVKGGGHSHSHGIPDATHDKDNAKTQDKDNAKTQDKDNAKTRKENEKEGKTDVKGNKVQFYCNYICANVKCFTTRILISTVLKLLR